MNAHTKPMIAVFGVPVLKQKLDTEQNQLLGDLLCEAMQEPIFWQGSRT